MDTKEFIRRQIEAAWRTSDEVVANLADDALNWTPPGSANTISATLAHILGGEDTFIQAILQGKPRIWETQNWGEKFGVEATPAPKTHWEEYRGRAFSVGLFKDYQQVVRAATRSYLERLSEAELDRKIFFAGSERTVAWMLILLVIHIVEHSGEIAALKGIQGVQGLAL